MVSIKGMQVNPQMLGCITSAISLIMIGLCMALGPKEGPPPTVFVAVLGVLCVKSVVVMVLFVMRHNKEPLKNFLYPIHVTIFMCHLFMYAASLQSHFLFLDNWTCGASRAIWYFFFGVAINPPVMYMKRMLRLYKGTTEITSYDKSHWAKVMNQKEAAAGMWGFTINYFSLAAPWLLLIVLVLAFDTRRNEQPVDLEIDEYYAFLVPEHCTIPYVDHTIALLITLGHAVYAGILYNEVKHLPDEYGMLDGIQYFCTHAGLCTVVMALVVFLGNYTYECRVHRGWFLLWFNLVWSPSEDAFNGIPVLMSFYWLEHQKRIDNAAWANIRRIDQLLRHKAAMAKFEQICIAEYAVENLYCWRDVNRFKSEKPAGRPKAAGAIYEKYVVPGGALQVNVPDVNVREIRVAIEQQLYTVEMFDGVEKIVVKLLENNQFRRFVRDHGSDAVVDEAGMKMMKTLVSIGKAASTKAILDTQNAAATFSIVTKGAVKVRPFLSVRSVNDKLGDVDDDSPVVEAQSEPNPSNSTVISIKPRAIDSG
mmetsp:Transcript_553/g.1094  ORF Transcript_553/g.1094 Transcript_553/m.1094 type:complete len:536 (-) Transcript_553:200-1807(-)